MSAAPAGAAESVLVAVQRGGRRFAGRQCVGCAVGVSLLKLPATARTGCSSASVLQKRFRLHDGLSEWSETVSHVCIMR